MYSRQMHFSTHGYHQAGESDLVVLRHEITPNWPDGSTEVKGITLVEYGNPNGGTAPQRYSGCSSGDVYEDGALRGSKRGAVYYRSNATCTVPPNSAGSREAGRHPGQYHIHCFECTYDMLFGPVSRRLRAENCGQRNIREGVVLVRKAINERMVLSGSYIVH
ncbi:uncharacterized protein LOC123508279 [Portunus trituberculatus]|uniref:uncharacterized protein LOC123508279 n=1 Tax=Portunus trituberculatus TaxID=210409 RepID=UPI001E1D0B06|nr:uncharacterized protein LOC123508279 [Portunus trituberculatus]